MTAAVIGKVGKTLVYLDVGTTTVVWWLCKDCFIKRDTTSC